MHDIPSFKLSVGLDVGAEQPHPVKCAAPWEPHDPQCGARLHGRTVGQDYTFTINQIYDYETFWRIFFPVILSFPHPYSIGKCFSLAIFLKLSEQHDPTAILKLEMLETFHAFKQYFEIFSLAKQTFSQQYSFVRFLCVSFTAYSLISLIL